LLPERGDFDRLGVDDSISGAEAAYDSRVPSFSPRPYRHFAPDDDVARRQDERVIAVGIEDQRRLGDN
jgi:hypothetical protein